MIYRVQFMTRSLARYCGISEITKSPTVVTMTTNFMKSDNTLKRLKNVATPKPTNHFGQLRRRSMSARKFYFTTRTMSAQS
jgi:hypothetical protein